MTHISVSKITTIGSDNGLWPGRSQAIIRPNAGILFIWTLGTDISEILSEIRYFHLRKCTWRCRLRNGRPFVSASMYLSRTHLFGTWNRCHGTGMAEALVISRCHEDIIKWKPFPRCWPFVRGNHRSPVDSPHKRQRLRRFERHLAHYDVIVMVSFERTNTSAKRVLLLFFFGTATPGIFLIKVR